MSVSQAIENTLIIGDLKTLSAEQRVEYAKAFAKSLGINILTRPFDYILFREYDGSPERLELYLNAKGAAQLRKIHRISVIPGSLKREIMDDHCMVSVDVRDGWGSTDSATGSVTLWKIKDKQRVALVGREWDNAIMKCETKAKRRATLSICGLAMLDESQLDTMQVIGGVTPEGRIFRYQEAEAVPAQLDENAAHGHPEGSERAKQAQEALRRVEEADKSLEASQLAKPSPATNAPQEPQSSVLPKRRVTWKRLPDDQGILISGDLAEITSHLAALHGDFVRPLGGWVIPEAALQALINMLADKPDYEFGEAKGPKSSARPAAPEATASSAERHEGGAAPAVVYGTIQRVNAGMAGKSPVRQVTLLLEDGTKPTYSCFDKKWFEFLDAGLGKPAKLTLKQNGKYTNIVGALQIGARHWLEDGTPVIQKDREPGSLFK